MTADRYLSPPAKRVDPVIPQDRPVYRVLAEHGFFGPDHALHPEGELIVLWDVPNEDMQPMNDMAKERIEKYFDELEASAKMVAEKNGRHFAGRPRSKDEMIQYASEDARRIQTVGQPDGVPIMGAKRKPGRPRIQRVGEAEVPDVPQSPRSIEVLATR